MTISLQPEKIRRAALLLTAALCGFSPAPSQALMPWPGEGYGSTLAAHGVGAWQCDFRDYHCAAVATGEGAASAGRTAGAVKLQSAEELIAESASCDVAANAVPEATIEDAAALDYEWQTSSACGPTDWGSTDEAAPAAHVGRAIEFVWNLRPVCPFAPATWESLRDIARVLCGPPRLAAQQAKMAQRATSGGARIAVRAAAGQLSLVLNVVGRQCLGASAALNRVASDESATDAGTASAARPTWGPQPCMAPYGHLGL